MSTELYFAREQNRHLGSRVRQQEQQLADQRTQLAQHQEQAAQDQNVHQQELNALRSREAKKALVDRLNLLHRAITQLHSTVQEKDIKIQQMQAEKTELIEVIDNLYDDVRELKTSKQQLETEKNTEIKQMQAEEKTLNKIIDDLYDDIRKLKASNQQLEKEKRIEERKREFGVGVFQYRKIQKERDDLRRLVDRLGDKNASLEQELKRVVEEEKELVSTVKDMADRVSYLDDENQRFKEKLPQPSLRKEEDAKSDQNEGDQYKALIKDMAWTRHPQWRIVATTYIASLEKKAETHKASATVSEALKEIEASKVDLLDEYQRNNAREQALRDDITELEDKNSKLERQLRSTSAVAKIDWDHVQNWIAVRERAQILWAEKIERLSAQFRAVEKVADKLKDKSENEEVAFQKQKEKIEQLREEKVFLFNNRRNEARRLLAEIEVGKETNNVLREQIGMLKEQAEEMMAERKVSDHGNEKDSEGENDGEQENDNVSEAESSVFWVPSEYSHEEDRMTTFSEAEARVYGVEPDNISDSNNGTEEDSKRTEAEAEKHRGVDTESVAGWINEVEESENDSLEQGAIEQEATEDNNSGSTEFEDIDSEENNPENIDLEQAKSEDIDDIEDTKAFLAHFARLYLKRLKADRSFKLGKISGREQDREEADISKQLDSIRITRSRERAREIWLDMLGGMRGIGDADRQLEFLKETVRIMELRESTWNGLWKKVRGKETLEELLDRLPKARTRGGNE